MSSCTLPPHFSLVESVGADSSRQVRIDKPFGSYKLFAEQTGDDIYQYDVFIKDQSLTVSAKGPAEMSISEVPGEFRITEPGTYTIIARPKVTGKFRDYQLKGLSLVPVP